MSTRSNEPGKPAATAGTSAAKPPKAGVAGENVTLQLLDATRVKLTVCVMAPAATVAVMVTEVPVAVAEYPEPPELMRATICAAVSAAVGVVSAVVAVAIRFTLLTRTALNSGRLVELQVPPVATLNVARAGCAGTAAVPGCITLVG